jgi:GR25 family glycosyltransferase involved in LPS biosynthesis
MESLKTYCINLRRRQDRLETIKSMFEKHKSFFDVSYIEAIDGKDLTEFPRSLGTKNKYACLLSHIKALESFKNSGLDIALVCEDDIILSKSCISRISNEIGGFPKDWDMIYLGYFDTFRKQPQKISDSVLKLNKQNLGAFAYIVNKKSVKKLISCLKEENTFTDNAFANRRYYDGINAYCFYPFLCYVKNDYSDTSQTLVNYESHIKIHFKD